MGTDHYKRLANELYYQLENALLPEQDNYFDTYIKLCKRTEEESNGFSYRDGFNEAYDSAFKNNGDPNEE